MRYTYSDKEIDIEMTCDVSGMKRVSKDNVSIVIKARGDFLHHTIEGIVKALKTMQEDNPHLKEV